MWRDKKEIIFTSLVFTLLYGFGETLVWFVQGAYPLESWGWTLFSIIMKFIFLFTFSNLSLFTIGYDSLVKLSISGMLSIILKDVYSNVVIPLLFLGLASISFKVITLTLVEGIIFGSVFMIASHEIAKNLFV